MSNRITKIYILRLTGSELTSVIATLAASKDNAAKNLARKLLDRVIKQTLPGKK